MAVLSNAFRKHGTYVYQVPDTIARYGTAALAIEAMSAAQMTHVGSHPRSNCVYPAAGKKIIQTFIDNLKKASIAVAGWGWCQGSDPTADARLAVKELQAFGLTDYIADIEHGLHGCQLVRS